MDYQTRKRLTEKFKTLPTDEEKIYYGIWYLLLFSKQEIVRDAEYRIYSILQAMDVIPHLNKEVLRYKSIISNAYKKALGEYNNKESVEHLKTQNFFTI